MVGVVVTVVGCVGYALVIVVWPVAEPGVGVGVGT